MEHVDPAKEARAQETRLRNHTTTLAHEYAKQGLDWEAELRQRAKEKQLQRQLGLTDAEAVPVAGDDDAGETRFEQIEESIEEIRDALPVGT